MEGPNAVLNVITLPPGATPTQPRIVLDGVRGAIFVYGAGGALIGSWANVAGTDPYGHPYPQGFKITVGTITGTTITGATITGSTFAGVTWIADQNGVWFYSGAPAADNLVASFTGVAGVTDPTGFNKPPIPGVNVYALGPAPFYAVTIGGSTGTLIWWSAPAHQAGPWTQGISAGQQTGGLGIGVPPQFAIGGSTLVMGNYSGTISTAVSALLSNSSGIMQAINQLDGNRYDITRMTLVAASSFPVPSTTPTTITGLSMTVGIGEYRVSGVIIVTATSNAGAINLRLAGPTVSAGLVNYLSAQNGNAAVGIVGVAINVTASSQTLSNGVTYMITFDGVFTFTGTGTLSMEAALTAAGDTYTVDAQSFMDVMPV